jgi:hypothetical protein
VRPVSIITQVMRSIPSIQHLSLFILPLFYVVSFSLCSRINRIGFIVSKHIHKLLYVISDQNGLLHIHHLNRISGVMVSVLASSVVDRGFESRSGQTKYYKIGICCFSAKHAALRRKSKDWLARNQHNVSEWSDMSTRGLLFQ